MGQRWSQEGLDYLSSIVPRRIELVPDRLWLGLFTSQSATTVPGAAAVLASQTGVTEAAGTGYGRRPILAGDWAAPAPAAGPTEGRALVGPEVILGPVGSGGWGTVNGFFIASSDAGGIGLWYANFDDATPIVTAGNDVVVVRPTWISAPVALS